MIAIGGAEDKGIDTDKAIVHRGRPTGEVADVSHNRVKNVPLPENKPELTAEKTVLLA